MKKNIAINLAIEALRKIATENWGWSAKFHPDHKKKYDRYMEAVKILEELRDGKPSN